MAGLATKKEKPKDARGTLRRILAYVMEYRLTLAVIMVLVIIGNVLSLLGPKLAGKAISAAAAGKGNVDFSLVYTYAWQMLLCYVSSSLLTFAVNIGMMRTGRFIAKKLRGDVFDKLMEMPVGL